MNNDFIVSETVSNIKHVGSAMRCWFIQRPHFKADNPIIFVPNTGELTTMETNCECSQTLQPGQSLLLQESLSKYEN